MTELRTFPTATGAFSGAEYARRYALIGELMREHELAAILFYGTRGGGDVHYLSNWIPSVEAYLLWPLHGEPVLYVQLDNHLPQARELSVVADVRAGGHDERGAVDSCPSVLAGVLARGLQRGRIGIAGALPYQAHQRLRAGLPAAELVDVSGAVRRVRSIRSDEEFDRIARAARCSDRAIEALQCTARPGMTELDLGRIVDEAQSGDGGYTTLRHILSTPMATPAACVPAKYLTDRVLQRGDVVVVELSAGWGGYTGQVLRTFTVGAPATPLYRRLHEVALAAYDAARATIRDGAPVEQLLDAVELIDAAGFTICDDLLHGANQYPPILRTRQTSHGIPHGMTFKRDMAVVLQPNVVTRDARAGVQYGQMLRVTADGVTDLHHAPDGLLSTGDSV
ncbi:MAG: aminopeptidase P family protein [Micromonosporaceae bacterium]|nr:aminopeptidase P family protein [Micromonosporaceae bacterium]